MQTVVHDDNRSTQQRFADRFGNIPKNFSDRAGEANKKMFEHNPGLNRWGNSMEFINGVAAGVLNPFLSAGEAIGVGDAVQGTGFAIDMATAVAISTMSPDNAIAAIDHLRSLAKSEEKNRQNCPRLDGGKSQCRRNRRSRLQRCRRCQSCEVGKGGNTGEGCG